MIKDTKINQRFAWRCYNYTPKPAKEIQQDLNTTQQIQTHKVELIRIDKEKR